MNLLDAAQLASFLLFMMFYFPVMVYFSVYAARLAYLRAEQVFDLNFKEKDHGDEA